MSEQQTNNPATTRETPAPGVVVYQPARGFRYSADAFWLAGLALGTPARSALDLGTGSGIVAFLLARAGVPTTGIDLRPEWAPMWRASLAESAVAPTLIQSDVTSWRGPPVDLITCNPPYFPAASGPTSPDPLKAAARTESTAPLSEFVRCGARHLSPGGRMFLVLPRGREDDVHGYGLHARAIWRIGERRSLVELAPNTGSCAYRQLTEDSESVVAWYSRARGV